MLKELPEARGPWTCLSREVVYDNPWIQVQHETVTTPAGTPGIYGVVHFKGRAVGVVPVDEEHYTYLVGQTRYTLNAYSWEIPEGGANQNETLEDCARRELQEEVGLLAEQVTPLGTLHLSNSVTDESAHYFLATGLSQGQQKLDATEDIQVQRLPFKAAVDMALNGEITDAISVAALLRLALEKPEFLVLRQK
jgi:8-oxo-dGTP pyrophosphatase MutT (NUDIX family)